MHHDQIVRNGLESAKWCRCRKFLRWIKSAVRCAKSICKKRFEKNDKLKSFNCMKNDLNNFCAAINEANCHKNINTHWYPVWSVGVKRCWQKWASVWFCWTTWSPTHMHSHYAKTHRAVIITTSFKNIIIYFILCKFLKIRTTFSGSSHHKNY